MDKIKQYIPNRTIDIFIFDGVNALDITGPAQAFSHALNHNEKFYRLRYISINGKPVTSSCGLRLAPDAALGEDKTSNDLLIPGGEGIDQLINNEVLIKTIQNWQVYREDSRIISVCSGALLLAASGMLNGKMATTHWGRQRQVYRDFPEVKWQIDSLFTIDDNIFTSAGVTTGIDLTLEIIARDCGNREALKVAQELVVYLRRSGGQKQFSKFLDAQFTNNIILQKLINAITKNLPNPWTLSDMAQIAGMTERTLSRHFIKEFKMPPVKYLERLRLKHATHALSTGISTASAIELSGFGTFQTMQRAFKRHLGMTIGEYQKHFSNKQKAKTS